MHRLHLGLYSHLKAFLGNGVRTRVNSKGKIPSTRKTPLRGGSRIKSTMLHQAGQPAQHTTNGLFPPPSSRTASPTNYQLRYSSPQDSQPNTLPTSYSGPHQAGQPVQHTTNQLLWPPSSRTASPTHYQPAIPAPRTASPTHYQPAIPAPRTASPTHYQRAIPAPF